MKFFFILKQQIIYVISKDWLNFIFCIINYRNNSGITFVFNFYYLSDYIGINMNELYPVFIKLTNKICIVIGGGKIATRKVKSLLRAKANITVVSPEITTELRELAEKNEITYIAQKYEHSFISDAFLVIAATNDEQVNIKIFQQAEKNNSLVNIVDVPDLCNFYVPSVYQQGDLKIAISTNGKAPALARSLREEFEKLLPAELAERIIELDNLRQAQKQSMPEDLKSRENMAQTQARKVIRSLFK